MPVSQHRPPCRSPPNCPPPDQHRWLANQGSRRRLATAPPSRTACAAGPAAASSVRAGSAEVLNQARDHTNRIEDRVLRTPSSPGGQDPRPLRAAPADPAPGAGPGRPGLPRRPCRHDWLDQVFHRAVQDVQQRHEDLQAQPFGPVLSAAGARARIGLNHANQPTRVRFRISGGDPEGIPGMDRGGTAKARESRVSLRRQAASMAGNTASRPRSTNALPCDADSSVAVEGALDEVKPRLGESAGCADVLALPCWP